MEGESEMTEPVTEERFLQLGRAYELASRACARLEAQLAQLTKERDDARQELADYKTLLIEKLDGTWTQP